MATPAAVLSIMVKAQGTQAAIGQLGSLDKSARTAGRGLATTEGHAKRSSKTFSAMGTAAKSAGVLIGAAGLAKGISSAVSEYREAQKTGAQTTAVLKSTGGAAKVTAKHIQDLAGSISKKSGIDDEAIQASENMLLTFTKLRNETGKGNKIFDQATQVVTDMSVALGQSGKSSAIQLGKALNDPVKGVTALGRVGVKFDDQQKKQIATMVKAGDTLGAQKVILKELKTEFAGSAAAQATAGDKFKRSLNDLAEAAGAVLVPVMDKVLPVLTRFFDQMVKGTGVGGALISKFKEFGGALTPLGESIRTIVSWLVKYQAIVVPLIAGVGGLAIAIRLVNIAMEANPWVRAAIVIAALVVGVVTAYREFATFRHIVDTVVGAVQSAFPTIVAMFQAIVAAVKSALPTIAAIARGAMAAFVAVFRAVWPVIKTIFQGGITVLKGIISGAAQIFSGAVQVVKGVLHGDFRQMWEGVKTIFRGALTALKGIITGSAQAIGGTAKAIGGAIVQGVGSGLSLLGHFLLDKFKEAARFVIANVGGFFKGVGDKIKSGIGSINPFGDGPGVQVGKLPASSGNLMGASSSLAPFAALGSTFGLHVSSGKRAAGGRTSSGGISYHGSGQAIDLANGKGPDAAKLSAFRALKSRYGARLAELIYTPGGVGVKDGKPFRYTGAVAAGHFDHVHVAFTGGKTALGQAGNRGDGVGRFKGDGPGVDSEQGWLNSAWGKVAPLFGKSASATPLPSLFKHIRFSGATPFVGVATDPGKGNESAELLWPRWLWQSSKGQKKLDERTKLQLFIHEMAHRFQSADQTKSEWMSEGGAEAFARIMMGRNFGGAIRNGADPYNAFVTKVMKEKGIGWVTGGQFANATAGAGMPGHGQPRSSGVSTAIAAARRAGFKGESLVNMIAIAGRESGYDPTASNLVPPDHSIGLWQINQLAHHGKFGSDQELMNPYTNARAAWKLSGGGQNLSPWNHKGGPLGGTNVPAARKAVLAHERAGGSGAVATPGKPAERSGGLINPLANSGKVIGTPHQGTHNLGNWQSDNAIDIAVPVGTRAVAVADGKITKVKLKPSGGGRFAGSSVTLVTASNAFFYTHLSSVAVKQGQSVKQGQTIGESGSANGVAHLHLGAQHGDPTKLAGLSPGTAGTSGSGASGAAAAAAKVNPFDQKMATADLSIQQAQTGRASTRTFQQVSALNAKRKLVSGRIKSIRKALKGNLSGTKRLALTQELTQRLQEHAQLGTDIKGLVHPDVASGGAGVGDIGGGVGAGDGGDPNQALIDSNAALQASIDAQVAAEKEHTDALNAAKEELKRQTDFATSVTATSSAQAWRALADILSGQIGGQVAARASTAGGGVAVRY